MDSICAKVGSYISCLHYVAQCKYYKFFFFFGKLSITSCPTYFSHVTHYKHIEIINIIYFMQYSITKVQEKIYSIAIKLNIKIFKNLKETSLLLFFLDK